MGKIKITDTQRMVDLIIMMEGMIQRLENDLDDALSRHVEVARNNVRRAEFDANRAGPFRRWLALILLGGNHAKD